MPHGRVHPLEAEHRDHGHTPTPARDLLLTNMNDDFWLSTLKQKLLGQAKLNKTLISQPRKPGIQPT